MINRSDIERIVDNIIRERELVAKEDLQISAHNYGNIIVIELLHCGKVISTCDISLPGNEY